MSKAGERFDAAKAKAVAKAQATGECFAVVRKGPTNLIVAKANALTDSAVILWMTPATA